VLLVTLNHPVLLVPLAPHSLQELLELQVLHHQPSHLRHILAPLLVTSLVPPVFLPLLPLSLFLSKQPEHVSSPQSILDARFEGYVAQRYLYRTAKRCSEFSSFVPLGHVYFSMFLDNLTRSIPCTFAHVIPKLDSAIFFQLHKLSVD
jgi:hypothetical protein